MSLVEKYVRKLLHEHDCVVLPELGGFIVHAKHAFFSEQHSLYHAPQRRVAFNEALKLDDGLLVHYLSLNEQMSREDAQKELRQYTEYLKATVRAQGHYHLADIGTLSTNEEGKYVFEPQALVNFLPEAYGFKTISAVTMQPTLQIVADSTADWTYADRLPEELPFEAPLRRKRSRAGWYAATAMLIGALVLGSNIELTEGSLKSSLNPFDLLSNFSNAQKSNNVNGVNNETVKSKATEPVATMPVALPPVVLVEKSPEKVAEVQPAAPKVETEAIAKPAEIAERISGVSSDDNAQYWVIACGFMQRENAEKLIAKLKRNGYEDAQLFNPDAPEGTLLKVAAVGFDNKSKANRYRRAVSKLSGAQAWVLEK
jgi:cell division septation protein DedD